MFKFKIFDIPDGKSKRTLILGEKELDLGDYTLKKGKIDIEFYKTSKFIQTKLDVNATVELICDRSLDNFDYEIEKDYNILFEAEEVEEMADEGNAVRMINFKAQEIDIEHEVRDTIFLALPVKKLHPKYLDENGNPKEYFQKTFGNNDDEGETEQIDPRWEALKELKK